MNCPRCRATLPAGSRFCNACGSAIAASPPPAAGAPNQGYRPPVAPMPSPASTAYAAPRGVPPMAAPNRRPVWLLALLLVLLSGGVVAGTILVVNRGKNPLVGGVAGKVPTGPGVQQSVTPGQPGAPGVVAGQPGQVPPAPPLTGSQQGPGDMAPSLMVSKGLPQGEGPGVTTALTPALPPGPSPITAVTPPPAPGQSPIVQRGQPQPRPQAPPDNRDFDRYLRWLQFVEQERAGLRAQGETQSFRVIEAFYQTALGMTDPDFDERQFDRGMQQTLNQTVFAIQKFRQNILRTKPPVPSDCKALDQYYLAAVSQEGLQTAEVLNAMVRKDIGGVKLAGKRGTSAIDWNLGQANLALEKVYQGRGLNQQFRIQTGGNSSMLGGMMGLGM